MAKIVEDRNVQIDALHAKLDSFLSTMHMVDGYGSWVSVSDTDGNALAEILDEIIKLKFETDCDGDLSVTWQLTDKTKHRRPYFSPMPASRGRRIDSTEWFEESLGCALKNIGYAIEEYQRLKRIEEYTKKDNA